MYVVEPKQSSGDISSSSAIIAEEVQSYLYGTVTGTKSFLLLDALLVSFAPLFHVMYEHELCPSIKLMVNVELTGKKNTLPIVIWNSDSNLCCLSQCGPCF